MRRCFLAAASLLLPGPQVFAQDFVEYPGHNATYGDHTIATTTWVGGPAAVTVTFETDGTLHEDGIGSSQRTARNTLDFVPPRDPVNPQNYDDAPLVAAYGSRLPLLQQLSASGTTVLAYAFAVPVDQELDLFVADLDQSDSVVVRGFATGGVPLDMTQWLLFEAGDLSSFKNTGTGFSAIVAPPPSSGFAAEAFSLDAVDDVNYNRSFSVLRSPMNLGIERIEVEFSGTRNSPNRAAGGNASHVYVALATAVPEPGSPAMLGAGVLLLVALARRRRTASGDPPAQAVGDSASVTAATSSLGE